MIRVVIEIILLFLLPSIVYFTFALSSRADGVTVGMVAARAPTLLLGVLGAALVFTVMVMFGTMAGEGKPGQAYQPAVVKDGVIVPGRMQ